MPPEAASFPLEVQPGEPPPLAVAKAEGNTAGQAALLSLLQGEEVAEKSHRRLDTQEALTIEGEDGKEEIGVGAEMKGLDPIVI